MKPILKFEIGEQYELHEFLLEYYSCFKNQQGYEYMVYRYIGNNVKDILGCKPIQPILLAYNADRLANIKMSFNINDFLYIRSNLDKVIKEKPIVSKSSVVVWDLKNTILKISQENSQVDISLSDKKHFQIY